MNYSSLTKPSLKFLLLAQFALGSSFVWSDSPNKATDQKTLNSEVKTEAQELEQQSLVLEDKSVKSSSTKKVSKSGLKSEQVVLNQFLKEVKTASYGEVTEWNIVRTNNTAQKISVIVAPKTLGFKIN